jgi:iron complex transport system ATP-binding protein
MTTALAIDNLKVRLGRAGRHTPLVLRGVTLTIRPGEVVGILGPNGAGKSTLIRSALGLLPAISGNIRLKGSDITSLNAMQRARRIAYVPQDHEIAWSLTTEAVVALGRLPHRSAFAAATPHDQQVVQQAMQDADVLGLRDRPVTALSGGERARVLIARALAQETPLLLADEPTSGLDPAHQLALLALFRRNAAKGQAIALSIHELHLASLWCDRLILLHDGVIAAEGRPADVLTPATMRTVYGCEAHIVTTPSGPVIIPHLALNSGTARSDDPRLGTPQSGNQGAQTA